MSKLSEFCIKITDGEHGSVKDDENGSYYFLNNNNITDQGIIISQNDRRISKSDFDRIHKRTQLDYNDIIIATCGTIGKSLVIQDHNINYEFSRSVGIIKCDTNKLLPLYLHYFFENPVTQARIKRISEGGVQKHFYIGAMSDFDIEVPSLEEQKRIVQVLSSLDAQISLNRSIISDLESLSRQIYDYWFVQFDFPDEHGRPYKSSGGKMVWNEKIKRHIPAEWEVLPLFEAVNVQYGFPFSTELFTDEVTSIPIVRIRDILDGTISAYSLESTDEKYRLQKGDVLVGMDGNFHMNYWHDNNAYLNQRCVRLRPRLDLNISAMQIFYGIQPYIKAKEKVTKGSTVGHLSDKDMKELCLLKPLITKYFNPAEIFNSLLNRVIENKQENLSLTSLRDFLLPMLMNGQVTIK